MEGGVRRVGGFLDTQIALKPVSYPCRLGSDWFSGMMVGKDDLALGGSGDRSTAISVTDAVEILRLQSVLQFCRVVARSITCLLIHRPGLRVKV